jgi:hypothetical protein
MLSTLRPVSGWNGLPRDVKAAKAAVPERHGKRKGEANGRQIKTGTIKF